MFLVDNVFRYVQAGSEVSGLLGRLPSEVGYQPTLADDLAALEERIASVAGARDHLGAGGVRPGRRPDRPGRRPDVRPPRRQHRPVTVRWPPSGLYPAIDPLGFDFPAARPGPPRRAALPTSPCASRRPSNATASCEDIISMLGHGGAVGRGPARRCVGARRLERFLTQPLFVTEAFTGLKGRHVPLATDDRRLRGDPRRRVRRASTRRRCT